MKRRRNPGTSALDVLGAIAMPFALGTASAFALPYGGKAGGLAVAGGGFLLAYLARNRSPLTAGAALGSSALMGFGLVMAGSLPAPAAATAPAPTLGRAYAPHDYRSSYAHSAARL